MWIALVIILFLLILGIVVIKGISWYDDKRRRGFYKDLGFEEKANLTPQLKEIFSQVVGEYIHSSAVQMGKGDESLWIIQTNPMSGNRDSKRWLVISLRKTLPTVVAFRETVPLPQGESANMMLGKMGIVEKLICHSPLEFHKNLRIASIEEMGELGMGDFILLNEKSGSSLSSVKSSMASILRGWAKEGLVRFIFYKEFCLIQIATPIPGSRLSAPLKGSVQDCLHGWRGHLSRAEALRDSV